MRIDLSDIFVRFRDLGQVWEVLLQAGLYATPIIYPISFIADQNPWAAKLVMMNPLAQIIQDMRYFLIDKANTPVWLLVQNKYLVLTLMFCQFLFLSLALLTLTNMLRNLRRFSNDR